MEKINLTSQEETFMIKNKIKLDSKKKKKRKKFLI